MEVLTAEETRQLLPYPALADALLDILRELKAGATYAPPRLPVPLGDGNTLLLMPATGGGLAITKLVTVHPGNSRRGLPVIQGEVLVLDATTGERLLMLEGSTVTARRTAALTLLAARLLAPVKSGPLLVIGAGTQARSHLEAFAEGLGIGEVFVASRTAAHAEALAEHGRALGLTARAVPSPEEVIDLCPLVVTATTSGEPVLSPDAEARVRDDAFVAGIGAYRADMAELPPALVRRARLFVDTLEGAQEEAGDLIQAGIDWTQVTPLEDAVDVPRPGPGQGPVVYKSVGHALWDLAAARLAFSKRGERVRP